MKESIINSLVAVLGALDTVTVSGKNNLANLSGSMTVLENIVAALREQGVEITDARDKERAGDGKDGMKFQ